MAPLRVLGCRAWLLSRTQPTHSPTPPLTAPLVLGSQTVTEAGGTVGDIGTLTYAMAAAAHHTPFCVTAPHYAFQHSGIPADEHMPPPFAMPRQIVRVGGGATAAGAPVQLRPSRDLTPPKLVTWYFTDIGVLPPAAVVDWQLTNLYGEPV
jgi:translation initiation factor 2B subunit (eIF-2B alpha/beta/delta family)